LGSPEVYDEAALKDKLESEYEHGMAAVKVKNWTECVSYLTNAIATFRKYEQAVILCPLEKKNNLTLQGETTVEGF